MAFLRISATSVISTMKVDWPAARSSDAPMRVKMASTTPTWQLDAGTKEPICAIRAIRAFWRIYVDLPAIFGPVMMRQRSVVQLSLVSLGTKRLPFSICSTTGWRPSVMVSSSLSSTTGRQ